MTSAETMPMTEDQLVVGLTDAMHLAGWKYWHIRRSDKALLMGHRGWPDITALPPRLDGPLLVIEAKAARGALTEDQGRWLALLHRAGVTTAVIRPNRYDRALHLILDGTSTGRMGMGVPAVTRALTVSEAASELAVSTDTVRRMFDRGDLEGFRIGRVVRISAASIDALLGGSDPGEESQRGHPVPQPARPVGREGEPARRPAHRADLDGPRHRRAVPPGAAATRRPGRRAPAPPDARGLPRRLAE